MKTRLITAGIGIGIAIVVLLLSQFVSPLFTTIIISLLTALMVSEVLTAKKLLKEYRISLLSIALVLQCLWYHLQDLISCHSLFT